MCVIEYYTYKDFKHWETDWELTHSCPATMFLNLTIIYQTIAFNIAKKLNKNLKCEECLVVLNEDWIIAKEPVIKPNLVLIYNYGNDFITRIPKIVVKVVSKQTVRRDKKIKFKLYKKVPYYNLVYLNHLKAKISKLHKEE